MESTAYVTEITAGLIHSHSARVSHAFLIRSQLSRVFGSGHPRKHGNH